MFVLIHFQQAELMIIRVSLNLKKKLKDDSLTDCEVKNKKRVFWFIFLCESFECSGFPGVSPHPCLMCFQSAFHHGNIHNAQTIVF